MVLKFAAGTLLLVSAALCMADAEETAPATETPTATDSDTPTRQSGDSRDVDDADAGQDSILDRHKQAMDSRVQNASQWVDSFFNDPDYEAEVATTQIRIRPELFYRKEQDLKPRMRASVKLSLPNLGHRVSLFAGNAAREDDRDEGTDDTNEKSVIGLQFFGKELKNWHSSFTAGLKFNSVAFFTGPRLRYANDLTEKDSYRFTQEVLWQTDNNWHVRSRLDFNHYFNDKYLFRQTFDGLWREERRNKEGYRTRVSSFMTQRLNDRAGLQYEFTTILHQRPHSHVDRYTLALRFRRQTARDWLYYEIVPQVSWEDQYNFKANPGIRLRLEIFYGTPNEDRSIDDSEEKDDDFRW